MIHTDCSACTVLLQVFMYYKGCPDDNEYAHPMDLCPVVDLNEQQVIHIDAYVTPPDIPMQAANYHRALMTKPFRQAAKPWKVVQPEVRHRHCQLPCFQFMLPTPVQQHHFLTCQTSMGSASFTCPKITDCVVQPKRAYILTPAILCAIYWPVYCTQDGYPLGYASQLLCTQPPPHFNPSTQGLASLLMAGLCPGSSGPLLLLCLLMG